MQSLHTTTRAALLTATREKSSCSNKDIAQPKKKYYFFNVLSLFFIFTFLNTYKLEKVENSIAEKSPFLSPLAPSTPVPLPPLRGDYYHF